jgi:hypothetical protein
MLRAQLGAPGEAVEFFEVGQRQRLDLLGPVGKVDRPLVLGAVTMHGQGWVLAHFFGWAWGGRP